VYQFAIVTLTHNSELKTRNSAILNAVLIKTLYVVLVLSMVALLWAATACYVRVRRHLAARHEAEEHEARQASRGAH
jgi:hypothetical protein